MRTIAIILILTITTTLNAQNFEGTLTYSIDMEVGQKMIDMGMTKEMLKSGMKSDGTWIDTVKTSYKEGFYRQLNMSADSTWVVYRPDSNKIYIFETIDSSTLCTVNDASLDLGHKMTGKMPSVSLIDTAVQYREYELKAVEIKWTAGTYLYFFSEAHFKTDPELFKGHIYDGLYEFLKISNSLPVLISKQAGPMSITMSLVEWKEVELPDSFFHIPELLDDDSINFGVGTIKKVKE